jgi:hypothetical protein
VVAWVVLSMMRGVFFTVAYSLSLLSTTSPRREPAGAGGLTRPRLVPIVCDNRLSNVCEHVPVASSVRPGRGRVARFLAAPIAGPEDAPHVLGHTNGVAGFLGASGGERHSTEVAITENTRRFKRMTREAVPARAASAGAPALHAVGGITQWH